MRLNPCMLALMIGAIAVPGESAVAASSGLTQTQTRPTDISTTSRKHGAIHRRTTSAPASTSGIYAAQPGWHGADPSWGPGTAQMRAYQRAGRCVIDEGYGRYTFCNNY